MNKKGYFKGWYFKCFNKDITIAFIPAFHISNGTKTASLQVITDNAVYNIPFKSLEYTEKPLSVMIDSCSFSLCGIKIDIKTNDLIIKANIVFNNLSPIKYDIMGPFKFVPFMQCRHSVYSMQHRVEGKIIINSEMYEFNNDIGYIEGDCGSSFPSRYIWTQCNFDNGSLMLSVADIPFLTFNFTGIIGVILINGKEYRIATYLGARLEYVDNNTVTVKQGNYLLTAKLVQKNSLPLNAPNNGKMNRKINESASCHASYSFKYKDKTICEFISNKASFEFEYH